MKVMLLGVGAIGTVAAKHMAGHRAIESLTLADMDTTRAAALAKELGGSKLKVEKIDAADRDALGRSIKGYGLVISAVLPRFNMNIMEAALKAGSHYLDLASETGEDEFEHDAAWKKAGLLAVNGMGEDPGISNVFARYAADRLDEVETIRVLDGEYSESDEFPMACLFSTETFIEEAVSPARYFKNGQHQEYPPRSNREVFEFPSPVGPLPIFNMSHEEVETLPHSIGKGVKSVEFKLACTDEMDKQLSFLDSIGMTRRDTVRVRGGEVSPLAVLAAVLPQPAEIGGKIKGAASILVQVTGRKGGKPVQHTLYSALTHDDAYKRMKMTATAYLTGTGAAAGALAIATGKAKTTGVVPPEMLDAEPMLGILEELGLKVHKSEKAL
jgi:saccharopine dehydrogenase-like NADP-dependent oxidoreductase